MKHYLYFPFRSGEHMLPDSEDETIGGAMIQGIKYFKRKYSAAGNNAHGQKSTAGCVVFRPESVTGQPESGPLRVIENTDLLQIIAHGHGDETKRDQLKSERCETITAQMLAEDLVGLGLRKNHKLIKMLSCHGAGNLLSGSVPQTTGNSFFACVLAKTLKKNHGFNDVVVGGYVGAHRAPQKPRSTTDRKASAAGGARVDTRTLHDKSKVVEQDGEKRDHSAHDWIIWFNGDGTTVDRVNIAQMKRT